VKLKVVLTIKVAIVDGIEYFSLWLTEPGEIYPHKAGSLLNNEPTERFLPSFANYIAEITRSKKQFDIKIE
jgi:hypothetical protein